MTKLKSSRIKILSDDVINRIAAGEIVERPSSIVKELVENSIDANSTRIDVSVVNGGNSFISVVDDGIGLSKNQALLAFERNATSKISSFEDISNIDTMGFRGEALPSIASVAKVIMKSRTKDNNSGVKIEIDNGKVLSVKDIGCSIGTTIEVIELFKKVPARKNTLKNASTEFHHVQRTVGERLLSFHDLHFTLTHHNKKVIDSPGFGNIKDKLQHYIGEKIISEGIFFNRFDEQTGIRINGFLASPFFVRKTKSYQYMFVNKRAIVSNVLISAIYNAYRPYLTDTKDHPIFAIFLESPPFFIDVNVHPSKYEVRFKNSNQVYKSLLETISYQLNTADFKPAFYRDNLNYDKEKMGRKSVKPYNFQGEVQRKFPDYKVDNSYPDKIFKKDTLYSSNVDLHDNGYLTPLSQFNNTYIIAKGKDKIILIDQHTAHERILYEKFFSELMEERIPSQKFLFPHQVEVTQEDMDIIMNNWNMIIKSGFDIIQKDKNYFLINSAPALLLEGEIEKSFLSLVDDIKSEGYNIDRERLVDRMAKTLACHSAVRSGEELTMNKMQDLIRLLAKTNTPAVCPHGRPTMVELSVEEIEKIFKRR